MASANAIKKMSAMVVSLPECPVCLETMTAPIFLCQSGHSLCNTCTTKLMPPLCPICRQAMTQMRNWHLEKLAQKGKLPCPNKANGCMYTMGKNPEKHVKECIFRQMECPLGAVFGRCSWQGKLSVMMDHFKECHAENCDVNADQEVVLKNISILINDRRFFLVAQGKLIFIITMKIDTLQKMAYWTIQHIGSKNGAKQHIYEIHVTSNQDARRKVVFIDHCFNDVIKADEVIRSAKCAVLPLNVLAHFIKDNRLNFSFTIKKILPASLKDKGGDDDDDNMPPNQGSKSLGRDSKDAPPKGQQNTFGKAPKQNIDR